MKRRLSAPIMIRICDTESFRATFSRPHVARQTSAIIRPRRGLVLCSRKQARVFCLYRAFEDGSPFTIKTSTPASSQDRPNFLPAENLDTSCHPQDVPLTAEPCAPTDLRFFVPWISYRQTPIKPHITRRLCCCSSSN